MSIFIDWSRLLEDENELETQIRDFLHEQFQNIELPPFIQSLAVPSIKLGTTAPEITIRHMSDPFAEFYEDSEDESPGSGPGSPLANSDSNMGTNSFALDSAAEESDQIGDPNIPTTTDSGNPSLLDTPDLSHPEQASEPSRSMHVEIPKNVFGGLSTPVQDGANSGETNDDADVPSGIMSPLNGPFSRPFGRSPTVSGLLNYSRLGRGFSPVPGSSRSGSVSGTLNAGADDTAEMPPTPVDTGVLDTREGVEEMARGTARAIAETIASGVSGGILESALLGSPTPVSGASPFDVQTFVEIKYQGDMQLGVTATLLVNYPSPSFISLPLEFQIKGLEIHSLAVIAYLQEKQRAHVSILCDIDANDQMLSENVKVIQSMRMESKIGDDSEHGAVLRNVGRVEKFILEQLRKVIQDEVVWPGWFTLEL